jgi:hypothetical protein
MRARISPNERIDRDPCSGTGECNFGGQALEAASLLAIGGVQILVARCVMQGVCGRIFPRASIFTAEVVITRIDANVEIPDCGSARIAPLAVLIA